MVPRSQIEAIDIDAPLEEAARSRSATAYHRRLPVYRGQPRQHHRHRCACATRSISCSSDEFTEDSLRELMREPYFIPSGTPLFTQLQNFRNSRTACAWSSTNTAN